MIVTCERCATQFQLDDERVPEDGVRVRCSRCKHAFFIERPAADEAEKVHRVARRALESTPAATRDLAPGSEPRPTDDELDEEDWHFADDAPFGGTADDDDRADLSAAGGPDDDDPLGASGADPSSAGSFDAAGFVGDDSDELDDDLDASPLALDDDDDDPFELSGSDEPLSLAADDADGHAAEAYQDHGRVDIAQARPAEGPGSGLELDDLDPSDSGGLLADLRDELDEELAPEAVPPAPSPAPAPRREVIRRPPHGALVESQERDDLDEPEAWHLADETESPTVATGLTLPTRAAARVPADLIEDEPSLPAQWLARAGNIAGWLSVVALFAVGLHGGVALQAVSPAMASQPVRVGGFGISDVNTHWIDNLHFGPMLVISGTLYNEGAQPGTALEVALLGADGQPVSEARAAVGPAVAEATLRSARTAELAAAQHTLHPDGWPWRPGQERRFHAVAQTVPERALWLRFEAVKDAMPVPESLPASVPAPPPLAERSELAPVAPTPPVAPAPAAPPKAPVRIEPATPSQPLARSEAPAPAPPAAPAEPVAALPIQPPPQIAPTPPVQPAAPPASAAAAPPAAPSEPPPTASTLPVPPAAAAPSAP